MNRKLHIVVEAVAELMGGDWLAMEKNSFVSKIIKAIQKTIPERQ